MERAVETKMHIGMIAYTNYENDPRVRREAEALAARGDRVDFLCLKVKDDERTREISGVMLRFLNAKKYQGDSAVKYIMSYVRFLFLAAFRIAAMHVRDRFDVIHVHTMPDFLVFSAIVPKLLGAKVVLDVHDLTPELYATKFGAGQEKFFILLNTPDQRVFNREGSFSPRRDGRFRVIYHGTLSRRHGLETAIRAAAALRTKIPALSLEIIGDGDDLSRLKKLAEELSLGDVVSFSGRFVPMMELCSMIRSCDLGVIPIFNDVFTRYMLPTKLLEYTFLGIPSVVSRTSTIEAYFDDTMVRYVEAGSVQSLADAVEDLYRHPEKRDALVRNSNRFNEEFSWEKQKGLFYDFVDGLAGAGRSGSR
jgi:glycosyltransferase involved in cell wall biosynthesis